MDSLFTAALLGCLLAGGCAGPLDVAWERHAPVAPKRLDTGRGVGLVLKDAQAPAEPSAAHPLDGLDALSLDEAIRVAIRNAPAMRRAGLRVDAASGRVKQAGLYPNPSFVVDAEGLGGGGGASGGETVYRIEQEIVLGGKLRKGVRVAEAERRIAEAGVIGAEFEIASRVMRAYAGALGARERLENRGELLELAERVLSGVTTRVNAGAATEAERLRAEVAWERAQLDHDAARIAYASSLAELGAAMGLDGALELPLSGELRRLPEIEDRESLLAAALELNARVARSREAQERAQRAYELARSAAVPNLVASVGPRYSDAEDETTIDAGIGVEIPLFDRNQGGIQEALAERLSSSAALREVRLELAAEVARAYAAYEAAEISARRYRDRLLPKAERTLELTRQAYERGKADALRLLDAQQVVVESRIAYVDALQRLHESVALLRELAQDEAPWREPAPGDDHGENQP